MLENLIAIDIESSGPDPFRNQLLAISLIPFNENLNSLSVFVKYDEILWSETAKDYFKNYQEQWEQEAVSKFEAYIRINNYLNSLPESVYFLVGHNVGFDFSFLKQLVYQCDKTMFSKLSHRSIDTFSIAHSLYLVGEMPELKNGSEQLFSYFSVLPSSELRHTAYADAFAVKEVYKLLLNKISNKNLDY